VCVCVCVCVGVVVLVHVHVLLMHWYILELVDGTVVRLIYTKYSNIDDG